MMLPIPHQLRFGTSVTLSDGSVITNAGAGALCMQCHNMRNGSYTNMMARYPTYNGIDGIVTNYTPTGFSVVNLTNRTSQPNWAGGSAIGTHDSPQADIFEGVNAETYGKVIASGPHAKVIADTCAGCHMQAVSATVVVNGVTNANPAFTQAGGHTFKMSYTNGVGGKVALTAVCAPCHGTITNFDMLVPDYAGIGPADGHPKPGSGVAQETVHASAAAVYQSNPANYAADGLIKVYDGTGAWSDSMIANYTNLPMKYLRGYYNYDIVYRDNSWGVHNAQYAVGLLKASIADLTGDANGDGLPDAWQTTGLWRGLCHQPGGGLQRLQQRPAKLDVGQPERHTERGLQTQRQQRSHRHQQRHRRQRQTNAVVIYTAAEIAFNTQVGVTYTIQAASGLTAGWQNISTNIPGTGSSISYLVSTRNTSQMFYRVGHTP